MSTLEQVAHRILKSASILSRLDIGALTWGIKNCQLASRAGVGPASGSVGACAHLRRRLRIAIVGAIRVRVHHRVRVRYGWNRRAGRRGVERARAAAELHPWHRPTKRQLRAGDLLLAWTITCQCIGSRSAPSSETPSGLWAAPRGPRLLGPWLGQAAAVAAEARRRRPADAEPGRLT